MSLKPSRGQTGRAGTGEELTAGGCMSQWERQDLPVQSLDSLSSNRVETLSGQGNEGGTQRVFLFRF